jgi:5-methylcytosine-specific restriction endonuclease McrA|tara:strand:+ start:3892 stop:4137 length:246 start_codon:yes stop_codon:yes gene_type:complete
MKKHVKLYMRHFGYVEGDFIPSEMSGKLAVDIHHVKFKSQGGKDVIENLIALTRDEHDRAHFKKEPYIYAKELFEIINQKT